MAMTAGTVTIDANGNASGGGMARAIFDALYATFDIEDFIVNYPEALKVATRVSAGESLADLCNSIAAGVVSHIQSNAEVTTTVSTSDSGLQRTPDPNDPNTATQAPSANKTLATKGTIA